MANRSPAPSPSPIGGWPHRSLLGQLPAESRNRLLELGTLRQVAAGETIIMAGDTGSRDVFLLLQGITKITNSTENGDTVLLSIRAYGDLVGELAALDGKPRLASVTTVESCLVRRIAQGEFLNFLSADPDASAAVHHSVVHKLRNATWHRVEYGSSSVPVRVARMLMLLTREHGKTTTEGIELQLPLPHSTVAGLVAAAERTVEKALESLREKGVICKKYRKIIIRDEAALHSSAGITEIPPEYGIS